MRLGPGDIPGSGPGADRTGEPVGNAEAETPPDDMTAVEGKRDAAGARRRHRQHRLATPDWGGSLVPHGATFSRRSSLILRMPSRSRTKLS